MKHHNDTLKDIVPKDWLSELTPEERDAKEIREREDVLRKKLKAVRDKASKIQGQTKKQVFGWYLNIEDTEML